VRDSMSVMDQLLAGAADAGPAPHRPEPPRTAPPPSPDRDDGVPRPAPADRPGPGETVRMRELCQAARGTVDPPIAELCRRAYG
ncbi:hypothetical protein AB0A99_12680, partial [Streptomyces fradiae]